MKLYLVFSLIFLGIGALLLLDHGGMAAKIANYIFYVLVFVVVWKLIRHEKN